MIDPKLVTRLEDKAHELRRKLLLLTGKIGGAHIGGSFSQMDVLVALYHHFLKIDPKKPKMPERDVFILSKGHAGVGYCVLLGDRGFFDEDELGHFNQTGSHFGVHPDHKAIPGVEASTGSLGHGLGLGLGIAMAKRMDKRKERVFVMVSDGELCEGSVWEAALAAAHHKAGNLTCIVDNNRMSQDGPMAEIMEVMPVRDKFEAFGWTVLECDGHDIESILATLEHVPAADAKKPTCIIANTIKGKGVPFMENSVTWHYGGLDTEKEVEAVNALDEAFKKGRAK